ncbi:MAG TPA: hypothetical protein VG992_01925 [Candidatus Saccharimonadales bacterium]|nr:hypothetical protein [Candidatus Saccharimonadales bacterium]
MPRHSRRSSFGAAPLHQTGFHPWYLVAPNASAVALSATATSTEPGGFFAAGTIVVLPNISAASLTQQQYFTGPKTTIPVNTPYTVALPAGISAGGLLVLVITTYPTSFPTLSISGCGATWAQAATSGIAGDGLTTLIWVGRNPTAGQQVISIQVGGSTALSTSGTLLEFAGLDNTVSSWSTNAKLNNSSSSGSTVGTNSVTPTTGAVVVGAVADNFYDDGFPAPGGYTGGLTWTSTGTWTQLKGSNP